MLESQFRKREIATGFQIIEPMPRDRKDTKFKQADREQCECAIRRSRVISLELPEQLVRRCGEILAHPERLNDEQTTTLLKWMKEEGVDFDDYPLQS